MKLDNSSFPHSVSDVIEHTKHDKAIIEKRKKNDRRILPIVREMRDGSYEAFEKIYLYSIESLTRFLQILFNSKYEAEETAQETFVYIWENRDKIDPDKNFKGFLYTVAKRMAFRQMSRNKLDRKYYEYKSHVAQEYELSPDELVMKEELALMIAIYIDSMPDQRRRVFEMSRKDGKSINEIATELNISYNTVKNHLQAGLKGLKELIALFSILFIS